MHLGALETKDLDACVGVCACPAFLNGTLTFHWGEKLIFCLSVI